MNPTSGPDDGLPTLPYAGTSGFAATSATSQERATVLDGSGVTAERQRHAMDLLASAGAAGITARELADTLGIEFHQAAPALSLLHKAGLVSRIKQRRGGRFEIYVLPEHVGSRVESPPAQHGVSREELAALQEQIAQIRAVVDDPTCSAKSKIKQIRALMGGQ